MEDARGINELKVKTDNKQILSIALPITLALLVPQINFVTNSIFLGEWSKKALGDAGITNVYYLILAVAGNGFNNALQSLIAKSAGEGNLHKIRSLVHQSIRIVLLFSLAGILFTWCIAPFLLKHFLSAGAFEDEMAFLKIRVLGLPFLYLFQLGGAFLVGTLHSRYLMVGFIFQSAVNIFLDYALIRGRLFFPQLGFNGAAVASVIAEIAGLIVVVIVILRLQLYRRFKLNAAYQRDRLLSKEIIHISTPLVLQYMLSLATWLVFFIMIEGNYNADDKAISNIMRNVLGLAGVFNWAFASTANAMVSNLIGQGRQQEVMQVTLKITGLSFLGILLMVGLLNLFPYLFFSMFAQGNDFIERGVPVLRMVSGAMLMMSVAVVWLNSLTGTGQTQLNLLTESIAIVLYMGYTYCMIKVKHLPLYYAWSNEWIYWITTFILAFLFMNKRKWKKEKIITR